jgi:transglutaminase-like putative cysteine protease
VSGCLVPERSANSGSSIEDVIGGQVSHAWNEVYIPDAARFGLDPTLGAPVGVQHVRIAYGRDYDDVAPSRGLYKGSAGQHTSVNVRARPAVDKGGCERMLDPSLTPAASTGQSHQLQQQQQQ